MKPDMVTGGVPHLRLLQAAKGDTPFDRKGDSVPTATPISHHPVCNGIEGKVVGTRYPFTAKGISPLTVMGLGEAFDGYTPCDDSGVHGELTWSSPESTPQKGLVPLGVDQLLINFMTPSTPNRTRVDQQVESRINKPTQQLSN